jgi:ubiquinone/menaquinone biosynthesis C-methylase UbiE
LKSCKGRILEAAVGSGRILIPLLEAGLIVDGLDESVDMLTSCRKRCQKRGLNPVLYQEKMQSFSLSNQYEAIIIPTGSFLLLEKGEESIGALKCFYNHLSSGGRLIVDIFLQTDYQINKISTKSLVTPEKDIITIESKLVEVNFLDQYTVTFNKYEKWRQGKLVQTELQRFPLRWYGIEEFKLILENIGFRDIVISADYKYGKHPTNANQEITFEAYR